MLEKEKTICDLKGNSERELELDNVFKMAYQVRKDIIGHAYKTGKVHLGASLSVVDIIAVLYDRILRHNASFPDWPGRDRFILSKGHACLALYSILRRKKYFSKKVFDSYLHNGSILGQHPDMRQVPGIEASTGSLGHGLSIGIGMALSFKMDRLDNKVYCLLGDGECEEGSVWEGMLTAPHFSLDNLVVIVDNNHLQLLDTVQNTAKSLEPIGKKFDGLGWHVKNIDGHNIKEIYQTLSEIPFVKNKPSCIVADTVKGKGISFTENKLLWHYRRFTAEEYEKALAELEKNYLTLKG